ncbi:hypothetical protein [Tenggerimyces flavus]|uniref:Uncharacterized protein n=1 Tax=Tenggerimyces flavus TaxID=1708749 RepID=A0ABV7YKR1_9ACTN|nr:hypothetical protein [Tenggerimyces flavus]MBM7787788.1 hypothetical protein [Tenggerimyces flavus]
MTIPVDLPPPAKYDRRMRLGGALLPASITEAWYTAGCPRPFNPFGRVPLLDFAAWLVSCVLRRTWRNRDPRPVPRHRGVRTPLVPTGALARTGRRAFVLATILATLVALAGIGVTR